MANQFFEEIIDEVGYLWGYKFNSGKALASFISSSDKYLGIDLDKPITFSNCEFANEEFDAVFISPLFKGGKEESNKKKAQLIFKDCRFRIQNSVSFSNVSVEFSNCTSHTGNFTFEKCFNSFITITNRTSFGGLLLLDSRDVDFRIKDVDLRQLKFRKLISFNFKAENIKKPKIDVDRCEIEDFEVYNSKVESLLFINSGANRIVLSKVSGGDISLLGEHKVSIGKKKIFKYENLDILSCDFTSLYLNGTGSHIHFNRIEINDTSNFNLVSLNVYDLTIIGLGLSNILVFVCKVKNLRFLYFKIKENVVFNLGEYGDGTLTFDNAILKGLEVNPSFLNKFENIIYKNSSIEGLIAHSFKLINPIIIKEMDVDYENKIDFSRELNALMIVQNNKHYATVYRSLELELKKKSSDSSLSLYDKIILNLNHWSNANGTRPQRAFFWISVMIIVQFGIVNFDLALQTGLSYEAGFEFLSKNYSYFIKPFTFLSDVEKSYMPQNSENMKFEFSWWVKGFDFLYKILFAYLLYQFIAAFRKFNK